MTYISVRKSVSVACRLSAILTLSIGSAAFAEAPVDLDAPDTAIESAQDQAVIDAADAAAASLIRVTPALARQVGGATGGDTQFRSLFTAWRQMDGPGALAIWIP